MIAFPKIRFCLGITDIFVLTRVQARQLPPWILHMRLPAQDITLQNYLPVKRISNHLKGGNVTAAKIAASYL